MAARALARLLRSEIDIDAADSAKKASWGCNGI